MELEHSFLRVPCENLNQNFRTGKRAFDKEIGAILEDIGKSARLWSDRTAARGHAARLRILRRQLEELRAEQSPMMGRLSMRLVHLRHGADVLQWTPESGPLPVGTPYASWYKLLQDLEGGPEGGGVDQRGSWVKVRMDRFLVDFMLRQGLYNTAEMLSSSPHLDPFVDIDTFKSSKKVIDALCRRDCSEALSWCIDNRRRLAKMKSSLEFLLRIQEFVQLVSKDRISDAITYARTYLAPLASQNQEEVQRALGLLAFKSNTSCTRYRDFYSQDRWYQVIQQFKDDYYQLNGLTRDSLIEMTLKAGMAVTKTIYCSNEKTRQVNCPTCNEPFRSLAEPLPRNLQVLSVLICNISGRPMNENNPPIVLPNMNVYSEQALQEMAAKNNGMVRFSRVFQTPSRTW